jgi:hypothetical protein
MNDLVYGTAVHSEQHPIDDAADEAGAEHRDLDSRDFDDIEEDEQAVPDTLGAPARHWMDQYLTTAINPFVRNGLDIIRERETISLAELCMLPAERETMLSTSNQECAARESLRLAELWKPIASNLAAEDGLRQSARFGPSQ